MSMTKITSIQALFPVALLSFVMTLFLGFQTSMMVSDRAVLQDTVKQQQQPLEQAEKVRGQANALAVGTLRLAKEGNKDAQMIIEQLKKAGIEVSDQPQGSAAPAAAPAPAAMR